MQHKTGTRLRALFSTIAIACSPLILFSTLGSTSPTSSASLSPTSLPTPPETPPPETTLQRIARTGVMNAGTRTDSSPFAFQVAEGRFQGFAVDLLGLIHDRVEQVLGRNVQLNWVPVTVNERFLQVQRGQVDLECAVSSITPGRSAQIDFSLSYFTTGTQVLVARNFTVKQNEFRIGVIPNTSNALTVETRLRNVRLFFFGDRSSGFAALENRNIDGFASDGILLYGLLRVRNAVQRYEITPNPTMDVSRYGCILPNNDPEFRQLVNQTIEDLLQGILDGKSPYLQIFDTWFGPDGFTPIPREPIFREFRRTLQENGRTEGVP